MSDQRYRVRWSTPAARDLAQIAEFIARDSPPAARQLLVSLRARAESLETMPERGRAVPELADLDSAQWREFIEGPYRVVYRIDGDVVAVLAVIDGRRDLEDILYERLLRDVL